MNQFQPQAWMIRARAVFTEKLRALAAGGAPVERGFRTTFAKAEKDSGATATIYVYDQIGRDPWTGEGVTAKQIVGAISDAKKQGATSLAVRILSPGGDVFDGTGIHEALKRCGLPSTAYNDGVCASAATIVALGCDRVVAAPTSQWMMHCAWSLAMGNSRDMRSMADLLDQLDGVLADVYAGKSGKTAAECLGLMTAGTDGTWMTAKECKEAGFADEIQSGGPDDGDAIENDALTQVMAQTQDRIAAANRARIEAASTRAKNSGASPGSNKPSGQTAAVPKK